MKRLLDSTSECSFSYAAPILLYDADEIGTTQWYTLLEKMSDPDDVSDHILLLRTHCVAFDKS